MTKVAAHISLDTLDNGLRKWITKKRPERTDGRAAKRLAWNWKGRTGFLRSFRVLFGVMNAQYEKPLMQGKFGSSGVTESGPLMKSRKGLYRVGKKSKWSNYHGLGLFARETAGYEGRGHVYPSSSIG